MEKKKILILYSTAGLGHKKAALGINEAIKDKEGVEVKMIDALEHANKVFRFLYTTAYVFVISKMKWLWGLSFVLTNNRIFDLLTRGARYFFESLSLKSLIPEIRDFNPDAVISTHFVLTSIAEKIRSENDARPKLYCLLTDYGPHSFWLSQKIDRYFTGAEEVKIEMLKRGIKASRITVTGIATEKEFAEEKDIEALRKEFGLEENKKTLLIMSGGFGVGPMKEVLAPLSKCNDDLQAIVVCGHNKELYEEINAFKEKVPFPVKVLGFTDRVSDLMATADLMVTKAGGISVTEALNARLIMILFDSIPGQESWNEELLLERGVAFKARSFKEISELVDRVFLSKDVHESLTEAIEEVRKPEAAEEIAKIVFSDMRKEK